MQIEKISSLSAKIEEIENEIMLILNPNVPNGSPLSFEILNSIKGVGIGIIAAFMGTVGNISRFSSSDKLISYIGFYPKIFESGKYKKENPEIQKAGPRELRYMLYLSSVAAIKPVSFVTLFMSISSCAVQAESKMEAGPSEPTCRSGLQTTVSCCGQKPWW